MVPEGWDVFSSFDKSTRVLLRSTGVPQPVAEFILGSSLLLCHTLSTPGSPEEVPVWAHPVRAEVHHYNQKVHLSDFFACYLAAVTLKHKNGIFSVATISRL